MDMVMILREDRAKMTVKFEDNKVESVNSFFHDDEFLDANWQNAVAKMGYNNSNDSIIDGF